MEKYCEPDPIFGYVKLLNSLGRTVMSILARVVCFLVLLFTLAIAAAEENPLKSEERSYKVCLLDESKSISDDKKSDSEHGGGLNACGCHFNRKTGECHCHRPRACGCSCQPYTCK